MTNFIIHKKILMENFGMMNFKEKLHKTKFSKRE